MRINDQTPIQQAIPIRTRERRLVDADADQSPRQDDNPITSVSQAVFLYVDSEVAVEVRQGTWNMLDATVAVGPELEDNGWLYGWMDWMDGCGCEWRDQTVGRGIDSDQEQRDDPTGRMNGWMSRLEWTRTGLRACRAVSCEENQGAKMMMGVFLPPLPPFHRFEFRINDSTFDVDGWMDRLGLGYCCNLHPSLDGHAQSRPLDGRQQKLCIGIAALTERDEWTSKTRPLRGSEDQLQDRLANHTGPRGRGGLSVREREARGPARRCPPCMMGDNAPPYVRVCVHVRVCESKQAVRGIERLHGRLFLSLSLMLSVPSYRCVGANERLRI
jgi:hypothetical protein